MNNMRRVATGSNKVHLLIDGNNLAHRAFWSEEARVKRGESAHKDKFKQPIGVLRGVLSYVGQTLEELNNVTDVHVFFDGVPKKRLEIFPEYKKQNLEKLSFKSDLKDKSAEFHFGDLIETNQMSALARLFCLFGFSVYHLSEDESDDMIASFVSKSDGVNIIVSSDKDFFQLVGGKTVVYRFGHEYPRLHDSEKVEETMEKLTKGSRVRPDQIRMFKTLTGDTSDGIKGIFKLRKKMAHRLSEYKSVEEIVNSDLSFLSSSERHGIISGAETLKVNHRLVGMFDDLNLDEAKFSVDKNLSLVDNFMSYHDIPEYLSYPLKKSNVPFYFDPTSDFLLD